MHKIHIKKVNKNGRVYNYYTLNYRVNNKYIPLTATTKDKLLKKVEILEGKNINYNIRNDSIKTFEDLFNDYLNIFIKDNRSIRTYISYKADINNHILPFFNKYSYQDLNSSLIQEFYNYLVNDKCLSAASANKVYIIVRDAFEYAINEGIIYRNPCNKSIKKKAKDHRPSSPIKSEYLKVMWELMSKSKYANVYKLMLFTALRRGEALGIAINDINLKDKTIYIHQQVVTYYLNGEKKIAIEPHTKTHLSRVIVISDEVVEFIKNELETIHKRTLLDSTYVNKYNLLFNDANGFMLDPNDVSNEMKKLARKAGNPKIRLHDLRHTSATIMYEETNNIYAVQHSLGHADPRTTENYVGPSNKLQAEGASAVAKALNKQLE